MVQPASGSRMLFGIAREDQPGEGRGTAMRWLKVNLPHNLDVMRPESPTGRVNPSGYAEPGVPGPVTIPGDFGIPMTAGDCLEFAENLLGASTTTTPETGVRKYVHVPNPYGILPTLYAMVCLPPTDNRRRFYGGRLAGAQIQIANNAPIMWRMPGVGFLHSTTLGDAVELTDPVSDYTTAPQVYGPEGYPGKSLFVRVKSIDGDGVPTFQFEALPVAGTPEWPSVQPGYAAQYDAEGRMRKLPAIGAVQLTGTVAVTAGQAAVTGTGTAFDDELVVGQTVIIENEAKIVSAIGSATGLTLSTNHTAGASGAVILAYNRDLGIVDENYDPLLVLFPGDITDHADLDVGDEWYFPLQADWDDPTPSYDTDPRLFTSAHMDVEWQEVGASAWLPLSVLTTTIAPSWPWTADMGPGSKYPTALDKDTESGATITLVRKLRDANWDKLQSKHGKINLRVTWAGRQIGTTGIYREQMRWTFLASLSNRQRPSANPQAVQETLTLRAHTNAALDTPMTLEIWTARDYTVATTPAS